MSLRPHTPINDIDEISHSIGVIADLVNEDLVRKACEGAKPFLREYELGGLMTAIKQLSSQASEIAEKLEEHEQRMAEIAVQCDEREGRA